MNIIRILSLWLIILLAFSCTDSKKNIKGKRIHNFPPGKLLHGERCLQGEFGIREIGLVDTFIIIRTVKEDIFQVYSLNSYKHLGFFGKKGKGPREFIAPRFLGQAGSYDSVLGIWILDRAKNKYSLINLQASLIQNKTVTVKEYSLPEELMPASIFYINERCLIGACENRQLVFNYDPEKSAIVYQPIMKLADPGIPAEVERMLYYNDCSLKPDKSKLVSLMSYLPRIDIYNGDATHYTTFFTGSMPKNINASAVINGDIIDYYEDIFLTDHYIFLLYVNQLDNEVAEIEKNILIQVLDWEGNPVHLFEIPDYILKFAVDKKNGIIYGLNYLKDGVYKYDIKPYLGTI